MCKSFLYILPRKVTELEKKEILQCFISGKDIKEIAKIYKYSPATISRQLKKLLNNNDFEDIKIKNTQSDKKDFKNSLEINPNYIDNIEKNIKNEINREEIFEVIPIIDGLDLDNQKELSSEPIIDAEIPEIVYLIVDKKIELVPKFLKDYTKWSYMPEEDLQRITLEIFADQKQAKKYCSKNEKIIKIPNSRVFIIASESLKSKGISRIIFNDLLLSL